MGLPEHWQYYFFFIVVDTWFYMGVTMSCKLGIFVLFQMSSVQFSSVAQSCPTLCALVFLQILPPGTPTGLLMVKSQGKFLCFQQTCRGKLIILNKCSPPQRPTRQRKRIYQSQAPGIRRLGVCPPPTQWPGRCPRSWAPLAHADPAGRTESPECGRWLPRYLLPQPQLSQAPRTWAVQKPCSFSWQSWGTLEAIGGGRE